jgi:hypothetical protein
MQTFQLNGQTVRFFKMSDAIYLIASDANKAFGFDGNDTALNKTSESIGSMKLSWTITESFGGEVENLPDRTLVIELKNLLKVLVRSNKTELETLQDALMQQLAKAFAQNFGIQSDRPMLPPVSDTDRVGKLASAAASRFRDTEEPTDKVKLPDWSTVTEMLAAIGESPEDENSLVKNEKFRFWINRQISDIYRAQHGQEPPLVSRGKTGGYCYPPSFAGLVQLYRSQWLLTL